MQKKHENQECTKNVYSSHAYQQSGLRRIRSLISAVGLADSRLGARYGDRAERLHVEMGKQNLLPRLQQHENRIDGL